jgi:hypothetical protein
MSLKKQIKSIKDVDSLISRSVDICIHWIKLQVEKDGEVDESCLRYQSIILGSD